MSNRKLSPEGRYRAARRSLRASEREVESLRKNGRQFLEDVSKLEFELATLKRPAEERARLRLDEPRTKLLHAVDSCAEIRDIFTKGLPKVQVCRRCGIVLPGNERWWFGVLQDGGTWSQPESLLGDTMYWYGRERAPSCAPKEVDDLADEMAAGFGGYNPFRDGEGKRRPPQNLLDPDVDKWRHAAMMALRRITYSKLSYMEIHWP